MKSLIFFLCASLLLSVGAPLSCAVKPAATPASKQELQLSHNGESRYVIALADDALPAEETAALQLQQYIREVTGAVLPVRRENEVASSAPQILVGAGPRVRSLLPEQNWQQLGKDGIVLKSVGDKLILAGDRPRGTLYAVFQFLEDAVGCRWWSPEAKTIPRRPTLTIPPQDLVYAPPFPYREHYATSVQRDAVFATIMRQNGHHQLQTAEWGGHYNILGWVHTFDVLLPPAKYFKDHPEWYTDPENGAKPCTAASKMPVSQASQLCLSNPEVLEELTTQALALIETKPEAGYISISQNDNDNHCTCPQCSALVRREGSEAGPIINFVNQVAARIGERYPGFWVETLAYRRTVTPPKTLRPAGNVLVRLAPIGANFGYPLDSQSNAATRDNILQWSRIAPQLFVWNYVTNFNSTLMPHPNWTGLAKDLVFFSENKVEGVFEQGNAYTNNTGDFAPLRAWLIGKLMWNPQLDQASLTDEFLTGYYGAAAPHLKAYIAVIQEAFVRRKGALGTSSRNFSYLQLPDMNRATRLFDQAAKAVQGDAVLSERVRGERISLDLAWLLRYRVLKSAAAASGQEFLGPSDGPQALARFVKEAKRLGIEFWGEATPLEKQLPLIELQFRPLVPLPEFAKAFGEEDVIDIQELDFRMHERGKVTAFVDDPAASDKKASSIIGDTNAWAVQVEFNQTPLPDTPEKWHLYAYIRAKLHPGASAAGGVGLNAGIYDDTHVPAAITSQPIALQSLAGDNYHLVDLGVHAVRNSSYIWFAPQRNPNVEHFYIDRVILIRDQK